MTNARTLINSHLFCVDNLSEADMHEHLSRDGNPVHYDGQHLLGYHWFAYPNAVEELYSKVLARVNMFGDLVIGSGEETCLVIIIYQPVTAITTITQTNTINPVYEDEYLQTRELSSRRGSLCPQ